MLEEKFKELQALNSKGPSFWSTEDVHKWLKTIQLDCYSASFSKTAKTDLK